MRVGTRYFDVDQKQEFAMGVTESTSLENAITIARERCADEIVLALPWSDIRKNRARARPP